MRSEGYRVRVLFAAALVLAGCAGPGSTTRAGSSPPPSIGAPPTAQASPSPSPLRTAPSGTPASSPANALGDPIRIDLKGADPIGIAVGPDGIGWVSATESGDLVGIDLEKGREVARVAIGPGGDHVVVTDDGDLAVSRIGMAPGPNLVLVTGSAHTVTGIATAPLGGLTTGEHGTLWALEHTGPVLHVDPAARKVLATIPGSLPLDQHIEIISAAGARWVSADRTPVRRISADGTVAATVETGGGIPLDVDGGLIWGASADELWAIDPATNAVTRHVPLQDIDEILDLDVDGTDVWIAARRPGRVGVVVRLELPTGRVVGDAPASLPAGIALTEDRAWVTDNATGELLGFAR